MRIRIEALALILALASLAAGQTPSGTTGQPDPSKPTTREKSKLEEMLEKAFKDNPDIRVAVTKLREAEAELERAKLKTAEKIVTLYHSIDAARATADEAKARMDRLVQLGERGVVAKEEIEAAKLTYAKYKAEVARLEGEIPYLLGKVSAKTGGTDGTVRIWDTATGREVQGGDVWWSLAFSPDGRLLAGLKLDGPVPDQVRKALDTPVKVDFKNQELGVIIKELAGKAGSVPLVPGFKSDFSLTTKTTLSLTDSVPLGAALQALEDLADIRFAVREYGLLVREANRPLPDGAVRLVDFWKHRPAKEKEKEKTKTGQKDRAAEIEREAVAKELADVKAQILKRTTDLATVLEKAAREEREVRIKQFKDRAAELEALLRELEKSLDDR